MIIPISLSQLADYINAPATLFIDIRPSAAYSTAQAPHALSLSILVTLFRRLLFSFSCINDLSATTASKLAPWTSASDILIYGTNTTSLLATSSIHGLSRKFIATGFTVDMAQEFQAVWLHRRDPLDVKLLAPERDRLIEEGVAPTMSFAIAEVRGNIYFGL